MQLDTGLSGNPVLAIVVLILAGGVLLASYAGMCRLLKVSEINDVVRLLGGRSWVASIRGLRPATDVPMPCVLPPFAAGAILEDRYRLEDVIVDGPQRATWRGFDQRLNRRVSVRLIARDDPDADAVSAAAHRAAQVEGRHLVPVLDLIATSEFVAVIWIGPTGRPSVTSSASVSTRTPQSMWPCKWAARWWCWPNAASPTVGCARITFIWTATAKCGYAANKLMPPCGASPRIKKYCGVTMPSARWQCSTLLSPASGRRPATASPHDFAPSQPPLVTPPSRLVAGLPAGIQHPAGQWIPEST